MKKSEQERKNIFEDSQFTPKKKNVFGIAINLEDLQKRKWGEVERAFRKLFKAARIKGHIEIYEQSYVIGKGVPTVRFELHEE